MVNKHRVLYFSISTFANNSRENGGDMYARNMVHRLLQDEAIELFVLNAGNPANQTATERWFMERGTEVLFQPLLAEFPYPNGKSVRAVIAYLYMVLFRFNYELEAYGQVHLLPAIRWAIAHWRIDYLIVDSLIAALFAGGLEAVNLQKAIVTVNREAELYRNLLVSDGYPRGRFVSCVSIRRFERFERKIYQAFTKMIAIGRPDIPRYLPPERTAVVTPYLDERQQLWRYRGRRSVFFVGNAGYLPNRLAIDYIVGEIAPRVIARCDNVKFQIIGASPGQIDSKWHHPAIELMGVSTPAEVEHLFLGGALLCAPIQNTFGVKFKVAEALSYGTPFLASPQTMLGFPYLSGLPAPALEEPDEWANAIAVLLADNDGAALNALSQRLLARQRDFVAGQRNIWSRTLFEDIVV